MFIVALETAEPDIELLGGKAASLARLTSAGLAVPRGFVLTTAAYRRFVSQHDLQPAILQAVEPVTTDPATLDAASATIRGLFEGRALPADLAFEMDDAYRLLGDDVAVA